MRLYIANAFSLSMLDRDAQDGTPRGYIPVAQDKPLKSARVPRPVCDPLEIIESHKKVGAEIISIVGHADTAKLFSEILRRRIDHDRASIRLGPDDNILVGQLLGGRLPPGTTELPIGSVIEWWLV